MRQDFLAHLSPINAVSFLFIILAFFFSSSKRRRMLLRLLLIPCSIVYHWYQYVKVLFSLSLSSKEQSKFEEQFKYLIVTSSLFNELNQQQLPQNFESCCQTTTGMEHSVALGIHALHILSLITAYNYGCYEILIYGLVSSYAFSCYFLYRHNKHVQVRKIHTSALDSMHEIISLSQKSDTMLTGLSYNSSLLIPLIKSHVGTYTKLIEQLRPLTDLQNLSRLKDMYMSDRVPEADLLILSVRAKRREYLLHLLALDVMSNNHAAHYGKNWKRAILVNRQLVSEYSKFNQQLSELTPSKASTLVTEPKTIKSTLKAHTISLPATTIDPFTDKTCVSLMQRIATVERQMDESQSKLFACRQDIKYLSSGRASTQSLNRISKRFTNIDDTMTKMMNQWVESKATLDYLLEEQQHREDIALPSPPSSPVGREVQRSFSLNQGDMRRRNRSSYHL